MTATQRAQQFWSVLVFAAREQKVVSYGMLARMTGMANEGGRELGYIFYYCKKNKLPLLNLLAINKDTGRPSKGRPANLSDLPVQQARVFVYDWLKHGVPPIKALEEAEKWGKARVAPIF
jgi:alkylated DNA nucleotide flippase Atl1